jgi:hypothetical protein
MNGTALTRRRTCMRRGTRLKLYNSRDWKRFSYERERQAAREKKKKEEEKRVFKAYIALEDRVGITHLQARVGRRGVSNDLAEAERIQKDADMSFSSEVVKMDALAKIRG